MAYVPNADQSTEPTGDKPVKSAAPEFRAAKAKLARALTVPEVGEYPELASAIARANKMLGFDSLGNPTVYVPSSGTAADVLIQLASTLDVALGDALIGVKQPFGGATARTQHSKNADAVSLKDFEPLGTVGVGNVVADTAGMTAALATGKNVSVPQGNYFLSARAALGYGQCVFGDGQHKTDISYSGTGAAFYLGSPVLTSLIYNNEVRDLTIRCTNRDAAVYGIELQNCVYFNLENLSIFGSGSPNDPDAPDQVLYGYGVYAHDNTIIGRLSHVSCRLWKYGRFYACDAGNQSRWTAAIVDGGQGELANCMRGIVIGDPTVPLYSGVGVTLRDLSFQGCYTTGINVNAGDNTVIENCYFEGNANYDIVVGTPSGAPTPIGVKILKNTMNSEDIGVTPYGNFPYLAKVYVDRGTFTAIHQNNMSISTAIPLISLAAGSDGTDYQNNRLNSAIAAASRVSNLGTATTSANNFPERAAVIQGTFTRDAAAASGNHVVTGVGFAAQRIEFEAMIETTLKRSSGAAALGNGVVQNCVAIDSGGGAYSSAHAIRILQNVVGTEQQGVVSAVGEDGFTVAFTKVGSPGSNTIAVRWTAYRRI